MGGLKGETWWWCWWPNSLPFFLCTYHTHILTYVDIASFTSWWSAASKLSWTTRYVTWPMFVIRIASQLHYTPTIWIDTILVPVAMAGYMLIIFTALLSVQWRQQTACPWMPSLPPSLYLTARNFVCSKTALSGCMCTHACVCTCMYVCVCVLARCHVGQTLLLPSRAWVLSVYLMVFENARDAVDKSISHFKSFHIRKEGDEIRQRRGTGCKFPYWERGNCMWQISLCRQDVSSAHQWQLLHSVTRTHALRTHTHICVCSLATGTDGH